MDPPIDQSINQPTNQSINQSAPLNDTIHPQPIPINQSTNQPTIQSTNQPIYQPNGQPINQLTTNQLINQSPLFYSKSVAQVNEQSTNTNPLSPSSPSINQSTNQPTNQSINESNNQSNNDQSINQRITVTPSSSNSSISTIQSPNSSINQSITNQPTNQPINRSLNLSVNQPINQSINDLLSSPPPPINNPPLHYNLPVGSTRDRVASENLEALRMPVVSPEPSPIFKPINQPINQSTRRLIDQPVNQSINLATNHLHLRSISQNDLMSNFEVNQQFSKELQPLELTNQSTNQSTNQPTNQPINPPTQSLNRSIPWRKKLVLCLVGLPARGKSYIAYKLVGYLRWRGLRAQLFNVGKHRREMVRTNQDANFFDSNNSNAAHQRDAIAMEVLDSLLQWLSDGGDVAVFDATNTTNKRRWEVVAHVHQRSPMLRVIFIESICDDAAVLNSNYLSKCKNSPDYASMSLDDALADLKKRISNYEKIYEPLADDHLSYLKLINLNSKVIANKIHGSLGHLISAYLMSIHIQPRPIYLVRTGKCEGEERIPYSQRVSDIGTPDSPFHMPFTINMAAPLTEKGRGFAQRLSVFMQQKSLEYWAQMKQGKTLDPLVSMMTSMGMMPTNQSIMQSINQLSQSINHASSEGSKSDLFAVSNVTDLDEPDDQSLPQSINQSTNASPIDPPAFTRGNSRAVDLPLIIYTSTLPRAAQTVEHMANQAIVCEQTSALNMMDTGDCHGLTLDAIRVRYPDQLKLWDQQRYTYRFPGGESQSDKARSLESLVMELERHFFPVLVVSHASTLQVLYGYFFGPSKSVNDYYSLHIPQHHVIELRPHQYGWTERQWDLRSEEEKAEDKQMRQEIVERLEKQGKFDFNHVMDENSQIIADYLQGNESRRGSDRFMKANIDQLLENQSKPVVGTMNGVQPEAITHAAAFYEQ